MKKETIYVTDDGKTFSTEEQAHLHEKELKFRKQSDDDRITETYHYFIDKVKEYVKTYGEVPSYSKAIRPDKPPKPEPVAIDCEECPLSDKVCAKCGDCPYTDSDGCCATGEVFFEPDPEDNTKDLEPDLEDKTTEERSEEEPEDDEMSEEEYQQMAEAGAKALQDPRVKECLQMLANIFKEYGLENISIDVASDDGDTALA
ncbi:MAG: hypothetical protein K6C34_05695 [Alphaproteobacteria bacterium]|nr:hypothetical protein [Alphaproteobacteria bacterium]